LMSGVATFTLAPVFTVAVPVSGGGTGASTAAAALTNLGAASLAAANTFASAQTFSSTVAVTGNITAGGAINTKLRIVTTATDTATATDNKLILNGVTTETLPAAPGNGQELVLINVTGTALTVSGGSINIWSSGVSAATLALNANETALLVYDSAATIWRQYGNALISVAGTILS